MLQFFEEERMNERQKCGGEREMCSLNNRFPSLRSSKKINNNSKKFTTPKTFLNLDLSLACNCVFSFTVIILLFCKSLAKNFGLCGNFKRVGTTIKQQINEKCVKKVFFFPKCMFHFCFDKHSHVGNSRT